MKGKLVFGGAALLAVAAAALMLLKDRPEPGIPVLSPRAGGAQASSEFLNAQKAADFYRGEIGKHPNEVRNYIALAQLFMQESRVTGRHHEYIPKAQYLLDKAIALHPDDNEAAITRASILMTMHKFREAKDLAGQVVSRNPHNAFSYGVLCDALVELGEYGEAVTACDKMLSVRPDLRSYARASYLRELHGDEEGARAAMKMAADAGVPGQENRAWVLCTLGNLYLSEGKLDTAEFIFKGILEERPEYAYALSGLAQVKAARKDFDGAVALLTQASEQVPEHLFLEQLSDVTMAAGKPAEAEGIARIVLKSFEQHEQGGWNVDKEYAIFCANHGINMSEALRRAKSEYDRRPQNIDALDALAWTLYKSGDAAAAVPVIEQAMRLRTKNAMLWYHAGMIYKGAGQEGKARELLQQALAQNPYLTPISLDSARAALSELSRTAESATATLSELSRMADSAPAAFSELSRMADSATATLSELSRMADSAPADFSELSRMADSAPATGSRFSRIASFK